jgi:hypothetical protein
MALEEETVQLRRYVEELRALLPALRAETDELRKENVWLKRWVKELKEGLAALTAPVQPESVKPALHFGPLNRPSVGKSY